MLLQSKIVLSITIMSVNNVISLHPSFIIPLQKMKKMPLLSLRSTGSSGNKSNDHEVRHNSNMTNNDTYHYATSTGGIYRPFINYAWDKLLSSGLIERLPQQENNGDSSSSSSSSSSTIYNSSPAKGSSPDGTIVNIEIQSVNGRSEKGSLRLGRFALLETLTPSSTITSSSTVEMVSYDQGIHVLNLVLFPQIHSEYVIPLPILGMDLVTLPGGKHLIAIDFQPILPLLEEDKYDDDDDDDESYNEKRNKNQRLLFPKQNGKYAQTYENKIQQLYEKHVVGNQQDANNIILPFGGEIPKQAARFFSPYALWTRLKSSDDDYNDGDNKRDNALCIIENQVYDAFCEYFDLYIDLLLDVQNDLEKVMIDSNDSGDGDRFFTTNIRNENVEDESIVCQGHYDYLAYRRENDPARPMLTRLYGNEWAEQMISDVLFKDIS